MFDKNKETRDSVNEAAKSVDEAAQEVKKVAQAVQTVKDHLHRNKTRYIIGGGVIVGTAVVGGAGFALGRVSAPVISMPVSHEVANTIGDISESIVTVDQSLTIYQQFGGYCVKVVQSLDDPSKLWPKIQVLAEEIAEENNITVAAARSLLNRHFRGELPNVFGKHYTRYGVTTTH